LDDDARMSTRSLLDAGWGLQAVRMVRAWALVAVATLLRALPIGLACDALAAIARALGPRAGVSDIARRNLDRSFPGLGRDERERLVAAMWDNLARTSCEYIHLDRLRPKAQRHIEIVGAEHLDTLARDGKPGILFSAHLANWEMVTLAARLHGLDPHVVYRNANNPIVDAYIRRRQGSGGTMLIRKGIRGARRLIEVMQAGAHVILLVDQKMNDGIAVPFFGRDAMTAPALAQLALRFQCPVVPAHVERLGDARFRVVVEPPLALPDSGDRKADVLALMTEVNRRIEAWVRAKPEHWLWLHRRWPKEEA
jgi:KDO2-lipid IV(A) lauroyltransferase